MIGKKTCIVEVFMERKWVRSADFPDVYIPTKDFLEKVRIHSYDLRYRVIINIQLDPVEFKNAKRVV